MATLPVPLTRWEISREIGKSADIGRTAAEFARHSRALATESAYASDWADFSAWCNSAERIALPAEPVTIGAYLSDRSGILKVSPSIAGWQRSRQCIGSAVMASMASTPR